MTLFSVSMFAADPAAAGTTLFSEDFSSYAKDAVPSGTVTTATGRVVYGNANVTYTCTDGGSTTKIYNENTGGGTAPEILVSKSKGAFAVAGIPSGGAKAITVSFTQNNQALSVEPTGTGYTGSVSGKPGAVGTRTFDITVADGADATFTLTFTGSGSSNVRVDDILVTVKTAGEAGGDDPEPTTKTIYCKCEQDWWKKDGAAVAAHYWKDGGEGTTWPGVRMTAVDGETDLWKIDVDLAKYEKIIFVRVNASGDIADWGAKSGDQTIPTDDKNLFTITSTSAVWGDPGVEGTWSKYDAGSTPEPPTPAEKDSIFFVNVPGWDNLRVHLWGGTAAGTTWPGVEMTKVSSDGEGAPAVARGAKLSDDGKINGYDVYKYVADKGAYKNCIFSNNGANQTDDLDWTSGSYFYDGAWYATEDAIPEPIPAAVPLEGNIWKVTEETPLVAGSHYIDEALLKMDGVFATTLKPNARTIAGEEFTHAIQVRNAAYPSAEAPAGTENSGSTSLVITAKENVDVTFFYARQEGDKAENDSKDLIIFDQAGFSKLTGEFSSEADNNEGWLKATKKVVLWKDHVYTVSAKGTTLQLHGVKLEAHVPAMQIAGQWEIKDDAWVVNNMTLAGDAKTATYEVELSKGDYEFKVLKDGAWLTKANDGAYGLHREWPGVAGVTDDAANNLKVTADAAGKYIFTWTFANDSIGITFPAPEPTKYFLKNNWNGAETWTWKEMTNDDGSYILAEVVFGGEGVNLNTAESDEGAAWIAAEDIETFDLSYEPATLGALDTVVFFFDPEEVNVYTGANGLSALILGKYVAPVPQPVLADGFYLIGKIGGVEGWTIADLKAEQKFAPNLENPVEFMLDVTLAEGDELKVVNVLNNEITAWFPGDGSSNFVVTAAYAGEKTVYFRPDQQGGEGWHEGCIYIAPNEATGIANTAVDAKAVKVINNGQLFIIRNGKTYTVQGLLVR